MSTLHAQLQVSEPVLQKLLTSMFPEGQGAPKLMAEFNNVAKKTNGLLVDAKEAVVNFWKARDYDPYKPEITKLKLGYALDQEEALGYLVVRAMGLKPLFNNYQRVIGKRVNNMLTPLNKKLKALRKDGARAEPERIALLAKATELNLDPPPPELRKRPAPKPDPEPTAEPAPSRRRSEPPTQPAPQPASVSEPASQPARMDLPLSMRCSCWFSHKHRACPKRGIHGSLPAALAIHAALECERLGVLGTDDDFVDTDDDDYDEPTEKRKMAAYDQYDAVLRDLAASFPEWVCCRGFTKGECMHDEPCMCVDADDGVRPRWPWTLCGPRFCLEPECRRQRDETRRQWCMQHTWIGEVGLARAMQLIPAELR